MEERIELMAYNELSCADVEQRLKQMQEQIDKKIIAETAVSLGKLEYTPLNIGTSGNMANYGLFGISVIDPTKTYILKVEIPEDKKPWYKRLKNMIKRLIRIG